MDRKKGVGLTPAGQTHYIDHLAPICTMMRIPLLFIEELDYTLGQKYYPGLKTIKKDYDEFHPEFLIANYDVLFMSDLWDRRTFHEKFAQLEKKYQKVLRHVYVPHGYSDKVFYLRNCAKEDIVLIYGQNMLDMLKEQGDYENLHRYVITGNYRYTFFKQHRSFYDSVIAETLSRFAQPQPLILYAPTWADQEESSTFFDSCSLLLDRLPSHYNMIVKLHPLLEITDPGNYYSIVGKYEKKPNVLFLKDFPLVYPLLAQTSIYIGDMSAVGYDFLAFNKPMFFLNKYQKSAQYDRSLYLYRCGIEITPNQYPQIYQIIDQHLASDTEKFGHIRSKVYEYTFGPERSFAEIKADIMAACADDYYMSIQKLHKFKNHAIS